MLAGAAIGVILLLLLAGILRAIGERDRCARMTEMEFEREAQRASLAAAAIAGLHKVLEPGRVEYVMQRDKRPQGETRESGQQPHTSSQDARKAERNAG
jgi:hypothetical protein